MAFEEADVACQARASTKFGMTLIFVYETTRCKACVAYWFGGVPPFPPYALAAVADLGGDRDLADEISDTPCP